MSPNDAYGRRAEDADFGPWAPTASAFSAAGYRVQVKVVDISGYEISNEPDAVLVTYSLGSCVGVSVYDPVARVGGLIHCMLPLSRVDPDKAAQRPAMFVDSGMTVMLQALFNAGLRRSRAIVKVAGAARVIEQDSVFRIGERNLVVLRKILWKNNMLIAAEHVGETLSRTMKLEIGTGRVYLKSGGRQWEF